MTEHVASRTLVKSPPELWSECSDATSLARHLDQFGEIRITRLEPETAVAWEGERARGTVRIEPSGWGTKVILTAVAAEEEPVPIEPERLEVPEPPVAADSRQVPDPAPVSEPVEATEPTIDTPAPRRRFARLFGFFKAPPRQPVLLVEPTVVVEPVTVEEPPPEPAPEPELQAEGEVPAESEPEPERVPDPEPEPARTEKPATEAALTAALDSLGQAHHRPYSRA